MAIMSLSVDEFVSQQPSLGTSVLGGTSASSQQLSEQPGVGAFVVVGVSSQQPLEQSSSGALVVAGSPQQPMEHSVSKVLAVGEASSQYPSGQSALENLAVAEVSSQQPSEQPASGFVGGGLPPPQQVSAQVKLASTVIWSRDFL